MVAAANVGVSDQLEAEHGEMEYEINTLAKELTNTRSLQMAMQAPLAMVDRCFQLRAQRPSSDCVEDAVHERCVLH